MKTAVLDRSPCCRCSGYLVSSRYLWRPPLVDRLPETQQQRRIPNKVSVQAASSHSTNGAGPWPNNKHADLPGKINGKNVSVYDDATEEHKQWQETAFPAYLQSEVDDFCKEWDEALQDEERKQSKNSQLNGNKKRPVVTMSNPIWQSIRKEAAKDAAAEPLLSSFLYASILSHDSFNQCLAFVLANRLSDATMLATEYYEIFLNVLSENEEIGQAALDDVQAVRERDPACNAYSSALLFYKGYQALQVHRIANHLWKNKQRISARNLQSRVSQVFSVDIHPEAEFGKGILMDHGTGIVVGQTARIGNNVSMLQNVTLGGTGKNDGDRHPKISDNVLIGAAATILGNITVGKGAMVAAGSLVLKPVPPRTMVAGTPAKEVGKVTGNPALKMQHWLKTIDSKIDPFCESPEDVQHKKSSEDFDNMLRKKSNEQPDGSPVPEALAAKKADDQKRQKQQKKAFQAEIPEGIKQIYARKPSINEQGRRADARDGESLKGKIGPKGQGGRSEPEYVI